MGEQSLAGKFKFTTLCDLFESIQSLKSRLKAEAIIKFMNDFKTKVKESSNLAPEHTSFYPILRLLLPQLERERSAYGIKEASFSKLYIRILCIPKGSKDANNLQNYRTESDSRNSRDFAEVAYWILQRRCKSTSSLTVADINRSLDHIANAHMEHKPKEIDNELGKLVKTASAYEQKWFIRIILKDLKLGIGSNRVLNLFHPDASDLYDVSNSLYLVCEKLTDPSTRLHELQITLFTAFKPMLSLRCDTLQINKIVTNNRTFYVENKFDGERFQLHMKNDVFKYFSKNGYDYTDHFGSSYVSSGVLTPHLKGCIKPSVKSIILDGEMMGWNKKTNSYGSKGMSYDVKNLKKDNVFRPCFCVFDILLYDDQTLASKSLKDRLLILDSLVTPKPGIMHNSQRTEVCGKQELLAALNSAVDKDEEGIVFKDPNSIYKPNDRKAGWWKMKLEYFEGVMSDLDVIIMGGYYGEGRKKNQINGFLMGIALDADRPGDSPKEFHSFARIASGLNEAEMSQLMQILGDNWKSRDAGDPLKHGLFWGREKPDVWIPPEKSCIIEVRGTELAHSADFRTEYSLRFPRMLKIRDDKMWHECMTVSELRELTADSRAVEKLSKRHLEISDVSPTKKKRRARQTFRPEIDAVQVQEKSQLLSGFEFRVLNGSAETSRVDIEVLIKEHGGDVAQVHGSATFCVIAGTSPKNVPDANTDIVSLNWLQGCISDRKIRPFAPQDMYVVSERTELMFSTQYDKYGDSFVRRCDTEDYKRLTSSNKTQFDDDRIFLTNQERAHFDKEMNFKNPLSIFRNCIIYFDRCDDIYDMHSKTTRLLFAELDFKFYGGSSSETINSQLTHIVMDTKRINNLESIKYELTSIDRLDVAIVSDEFIKQSILKSEIQQATRQFRIVQF